MSDENQNCLQTVWFGILLLTLNQAKCKLVFCFIGKIKNVWGVYSAVIFTFTFSNVLKSV